MRFEDANDMLKPGYLPFESGYQEIEDGKWVVAGLTRMPGCRAKMVVRLAWRHRLGGSGKRSMTAGLWKSWRPSLRTIWSHAFSSRSMFRIDKGPEDEAEMWKTFISCPTIAFRQAAATMHAAQPADCGPILTSSLRSELGLLFL
ncbi:hypothetical protein [Bradyrhizobium sp. 164]|uniref:DAPG hydrolase family protein n=1 Tax=Bradyrhizobium sp. 164 TaxID=2782637 RepID=UPI001FF802C7|nr:hypothetical protein [Bradyrhizobium sp. 164]MCK1597048.1 hypothetical protein [Bradyrhizobium sp. 164]